MTNIIKKIEWTEFYNNPMAIWVLARLLLIKLSVGVDG